MLARIFFSFLLLPFSLLLNDALSFFCFLFVLLVESFLNCAFRTSHHCFFLFSSLTEVASAAAVAQDLRILSPSVTLFRELDEADPRGCRAHRGAAWCLGVCSSPLNCGNWHRQSFEP